MTRLLSARASSPSSSARSPASPSPWRSAAIGVAPTTIHKWTIQGFLKPWKDGRYRWYTDKDLAAARQLKAKQGRRSKR